MYRLGLDIGTTSVGYAVLNVDQSGEPNRIIQLGSRIFDAAENPKDGSSLAAPRRLARGARRRNRRHRHRMQRIKGLLQASGIISRQDLELLYQQHFLEDIYKIRYEALDRLLNQEELARLLVHYAQRRGFQSNRKNEDKNSDNGKLLTATSQNKEYMQQKGYRTIGEMLYKDERFTQIKRNKGGEYSNTFFRWQIVEEINTVLERQKQLGNVLLTSQFCQQYLEILQSQRSFEEGPGAGPYSGDQVKKMVGKCTFEPQEYRGVKASYTFEYFSLLQKINHITLLDQSEKRKLSAQERQQLISLFLKTADISYAKIRKELGLPQHVVFAQLNYNKGIEETEKQKLKQMQSYHEMRKAFDKITKGYIKNITPQQRDEIATALTYYKTDEKIKEYLAPFEFTSQEMDAILEIKNFSKVGSLSIKAMKKIIPFLEQGITYDKACLEAGYDFKAHQINADKYLPKLPQDCYEITSPVVKRTINQTIRVINQIIQKYGSPANVNIELARELSKTFSDRKEIEKSQKENAENNQKIYDQIKETYHIIKPTGQDIVKFKLFQEQNGICLYTLEPIEAPRLFEPGYCEIDHIIPYSISFDDSYKNKVLVKTAANREKGSRVPMEYVKSQEDFIAMVNTLIHNKAKKDRLLKKEISEEDRNTLKQRSLQDTQFITSFMLNYIKDNLQFDPSIEKKNRVTAVNGKITADMRKRWGLNKIRENGDLHHSIDAAVVACITPGIIQAVTSYNKKQEESKSKKIDEKFPLPWPEFRQEIDIRTCKDPKQLLAEVHLPNYQDVDIETIEPVFVSRMVRKKQTGQAHKETIRAYREIDGQSLTVTKTPLQALKYDKEKDEIIGYYNSSSDKLLYQLLKEKLKQANGNAQKAFPEGFVYKPCPKGGQAPKVYKVKVTDKSNLNVQVGSGVAANGDMVRIDIYYVEKEGYYFIPIYVHNLIENQLPTKACVQGKPYQEWKEMKDEDFLFSLYPNDLIKVISKRDITFTTTFKEATKEKQYSTKEEFVYYKSAGIAVSSISVVNHDNSYTIKSLGIKTLISIEKYYVDILGNKYKAPKEYRK